MSVTASSVIVSCGGRRMRVLKDPRRASLVATGLASAALVLAFVAPAHGEMTFLRSWGAPGTGPGQFGPAEKAGVIVDAAGYVYVTDPANGRVQKFTGDGAFVMAIGRPAGERDEPGTFRRPLAVAVAASGEIYVVDDWRDLTVQRFDAGGRFLGEFAPNRAPIAASDGSVYQPSDIVLAPNGEVLVLSAATGEVARFTATGEFLGYWGQFGSGPGTFTPFVPISIPVDGPRGMTVDGRGDVLVADTFGNRVERFTVDGGFIAAWELPQEAGRPLDVAVDATGTISVAADNMVLRYTGSGEEVGRFGAFPGLDEGEWSGTRDGDLFIVHSVAAAPGNDIVVLDDYSYPVNSIRVQRFGEGGVRAPGSRFPGDVTATATVGLRSGVPSRCGGRKDCRPFRKVRVGWHVKCRERAGTSAGWAVALRSTPGEPTAGAPAVAPVGYRGPVFEPGPPSLGSDGWEMPDGTNIGTTEPKATNVLAYAGGVPVDGPAGVGRSLDVVVSPGTRLYTDMIGLCRYPVTAGRTGAVEAGATTGVAVIPPYLVVDTLRDAATGRRVKRGRLRVGRRVEARLRLIYDADALAPTLDTPIALHVSGAGLRTTVKLRKARWIILRPRRTGTVRIWATVGGVRTVNTARLSARRGGR
jgi:hypothetical protein